MPQFFFHVQMGELFPDETGITLPNDRAARDVALQVLAELARDAADELWRGDVFRVVAADESRMPLVTVEVAARFASF